MEILQPNNGLTITLPGTATIISEAYVRKLKVVDLSYNIENKSVRVGGVISYYMPDDTQVTNSLVAKSYAVSISATNDDFCDVATGVVICPVKEEYTDAEKTVLNPKLVGKDYMKQFDWFFNVGATTPVVINDMITQFLLESVSKGEFD